MNSKAFTLVTLVTLIIYIGVIDRYMEGHTGPTRVQGPIEFETKGNRGTRVKSELSI